MHSMEKLSTTEQQALRARAHGLSPVVMIGDNGLSDTVLKEIDRSLAAHELVKIRVFSGGREERTALLADICGRLDALPVQHIGKILVVFRRRREGKESAEPERVAKMGKVKRPTGKPRVRVPSREPAAIKSTALVREPVNSRRRKI